MRAYVFTNASLARHAGQFVWLEIDWENAKSAAFRGRFPVPGLPTFLVIDPVREAVTVRWVGGFTVGQLHAFLDDVHDHRGTPQALIAIVAHADSCYAADAYPAAAAGFEQVLAAAPADWKGATRIVESLQFALSQSDSNAAAIALARTWLPRVGPSPSGLNLAAGGLGAALALPESLSERQGAIAQFDALTRRLVRDTSFATAADDRSGAYITLLDAAHDARDSTGAVAIAREWANFLEGQAARARTPDERVVFDPHRLSAYLELGEPARAVPMLQQSERDLPNDYNPPARLATAFKALKRWDEALAASDRAVQLAYGPRKLLLYDTRTDIFLGRGDVEGARRTLAEAIAYEAALPESQRSPGRAAAFKKKLATLPAR